MQLVQVYPSPGIFREQPRICPLPVMGTHYSRSETDQNGERSRDPVRCKLYDARVPALSVYCKTTCDGSSGLSPKPKRNTSSFFLLVLSDQEPGLSINTVFGNLPLGACLALPCHVLIDLKKAHAVERRTMLQGESAE